MIEDPAVGIDIPTGEQIVLEIEVVLEDTETNASGLAFTNTAEYVYNRTDGNTAPRTRNIRVLVASACEDEPFREVYRPSGETFYGVRENKPLDVGLREKKVTARIVRLHVPGRCSFALDEVEVYPADEPTKNVALGKPADQKSVGPYSYPGTKGHVYVPPGQPPHEPVCSPVTFEAATRFP